MQKPSARQSDKPIVPFWIVLLGIFILAMLIRVLHIWQIHAAPVFDMRFGDSGVYDSWAREIAAGDWLGDEVFWYAPLYPYLLGAIYAVLGDDGWIVRLVHALIGSTACLLLADAGRRLFSPAAGLFAGCILALYAPAIFYDGLVHKPGLVMLLLCSLLWIISRGIDRVTGPLPALALGAVLGLLVLSRENTVVFLPVLLVWLLLSSRGAWRVRLAPTVTLLLGLALILTPVALRNGIVGGEFHLTAANFGDNFYKGNNEQTDGTYVPLRPLRGSPEFERLDAVEIAQREMGRVLSPSEVSRYWTAQALDYIRSQPWDWLRLMAKKLFLVWHNTELGDTEDLYTYSSWSMVLQVTMHLFHLGFLAPLALLGVWVTWDRRRLLYPLHLMLVLYPATVIAFYVFGRYRYPVVALLVLFAAAGIAEAWGFLRGASRLEVAACLVTVALALIVCNWPTGSRDRVRAATLYNVGVWLSLHPDRLQESMAYYEDALRLLPESPRTLFNLGNALKRNGNLEQAEARYRQALRYRPAMAGALNNLAECVEARGRIDEAIEYYRAAIASDPDAFEAYNNLGLALARRGDFGEAVSLLREANRIRPHNAVPHYNIGNVLVQQGRLEEAVARYRQALSLDPANARIHNNLGYALAARGYPEEAVAAYAEALRLDPDYAEAEANLRAARAAMSP
jgi:tetratricopeptide (TPR) repeat protein